MERDLDLVRILLLEIERGTSPSGLHEAPKAEGYEDVKVLYHLVIMQQAGLIEAAIHIDRGALVGAHSIRLTWNGHEFLDAARQPSRWNKARRIMKEKGVEIGFDMLKEVLLGIARGDLSGVFL